MPALLCDSRHVVSCLLSQQYSSRNETLLLWEGTMNTKGRNVLDVLRKELEFLEKGGYRKPSWRPRFIFEDSPSCPNFGDPHRSTPCSECVLMQFVPADRRGEKVPCRHIIVNGSGRTIDTLYRTGTQEEIEAAVKRWLEETIQRLEREAIPPKAPLP